MYEYSDIEFLNIELPEDILKKKWFGDFEGAAGLIDIYLKKDIPIALRKKLELEKYIMDIMKREYTIPFDEALAMVQKAMPNITKEEFLSLKDQGKIDWIYVNGEVKYFRRFLGSLLKTSLSHNDELALKEKQALINIIKDLKEKKSLTCHFKIRASVRVKDDSFQPGKLRVHIPIPVNCKQVRDARIIKTEPPYKFISKADQEQRTIFFEENLMENSSFSVEYEYDNTVTYTEPDIDVIAETKQPSTFDLSEQAPHILFTPYLVDLVNKIIGEEKNPYNKARKIYDYITTQIAYSFMREYFTIENIPEYAALNGKGDCGVQALLFIVLCRIAGIPARWQSGLYSTPYAAGIHDWAQFYIAPYGWLFADCSFGGSAYREGDMERWNFYFGNIDPFRMPANSAFQKEFEPPKKFLRADPYDNQRGEVEYETRGLAYDEFDSERIILECTVS